MSRRIVERRVRMMKEMLRLQAEVRARKEKERAFKTSNTEKYTNIFKPITNTLEKLKPPPPPPPPPPKPAGHQKEEEEEEEKLKRGEESGESGDDEGNLYDAVLASILVGDRDDGVFGLKVNPHNPHVGQIGRCNFRVTAKNDRIAFYTSHAEVMEAHITDPNLWKLLLVKNPNKIDLRLETPGGGGGYRRFVMDYMTIVDRLDLLDSALANRNVSITNRIKYKLIKAIHMEKSGSGFLFSVRPPPPSIAAAASERIKPSTVVIPSDKKGLLRELVKAVAELRAGNTSMRNIVVPLAQEAKRKRILPRHLLSADEKTWVFA